MVLNQAASFVFKPVMTLSIKTTVTMPFLFFSHYLLIEFVDEVSLSFTCADGV